MKKKFDELSKDEDQRAQDIHEKAIIINGLSTLRRSVDAIESLQMYSDTMREGGVSAANVTIASSQQLGEACLRISDWYNLIKNVNDVNLIRTVGDIKKAKRNIKSGIIFGFQGTTPLLTSQSVSWMYKCWGTLELFYNLGVRIIQLTYSRRARTGDGCYERTNCGVSRSGIDVIQGMNELGILLDLSHCGPKTTLEAIEFSREPVAFTHSGARALNDHARLKGDEEIKAMAEKGGVIGIIAESNFIKHEGGLKESRAILDDMLDHIDYVCDLVGVNHVGIGGDIPETKASRTAGSTANLQKMAAKRFEEVGRDKLNYPDYFYLNNQSFETMWVKGFESMAETLNVTKGLVARGYSDQEIIKIQGGNLLKLFEKVWK